MIIRLKSCKIILMKLIGSLRSPYVRRIRMLLEGKQKYEFETVDVFSQEGQDTILKYSPTRRVPILIDRDQVIWDSLLITKYLKQDLSLEQEKELILINEANDSAINLFQLKFFEIDPVYGTKFSELQINRINSVLNHFEKSPPKDDLTKIWLFCLLDWLSFREVMEWKTDRPQLQKLVVEMSTLESASLTDPRN
jgi:glutathione S-transferase